MTDVLCSLYDKKALTFSPAMAYPNTAEAGRAFVALLASGDSTPARWPDDFDLYCVGDFDRSTGAVGSRVPSIILTGSAALHQLHALRRGKGGAVGETAVSPEDSGASAERDGSLDLFAAVPVTSPEVVRN